jgi:hypothetical protein
MDSAQFDTWKREDMMATSMVADLDSMFGSQGNQGLYPPIARVVPHLLKLLVDRSHMIIVLHVILRVKRNKSAPPV